MRRRSFREYIARRESYTPEITALKRYFKQRPLDLSRYIWQFMRWDGSDEILERLGIDPEILDNPDYDDAFYDAAAKIEKSMTSDEREAFVWYLQAGNSGHEAPTWTHMDFQRVVSPSTWLVHFSDEAGDMFWHGFKQGTPDFDDLSYTVFLPKVDKEFGGFNFAFTVDSRYARSAAHSGKYGKDALLFQAAGIEAYHYGDEEDQIIFDGATVKPGQMILLEKAGSEFCVRAHGTMADRGRECAYQGSYEEAVEWVQRNLRQYRKQIM